MSTPAQHLAAYDLWTRTAEQFADVARELKNAGDTKAAAVVQAHADRYTQKSRDELLAAAKAVEVERSG